MQESSATTVYLVRHGQTAWNLERRFQGHLDVHLNGAGVGQARALASWMGAQPVTFHAIYSSDLTRAADTARAIGRAVGLSPHLVPELREIDCGEWAGLSIWDVEQRYPGQLKAWHCAADSYTVPGGECVADVQRRAVSFCLDRVRCHKAQNIVVVGHGVVLTAILAGMHG
jgi:broad specificity phosphatase PhoE